MSTASTTASRTKRLLHGPIVSTLLRLAAPGVVLVAFQSAVSITDSYFVGQLGTIPLAGIALVFPLVMLLQMTSAGAMGGGVSSAIARALGAGDLATARRLVVHALVIGLGMGALFTLLLLVLGPSIYQLLGGQNEDTLAQALAYSNMLFAGSILVWLANTLASILRGSGNMSVPAFTLAAASVVHIPLCGLLVQGAAGVPAMGIRGAGVAYVCAAAFSTLVMMLYLIRPSSRLRPMRTDWQLDRSMFREIFRVGAVSSLSSLQTVLTSVILTGIVGSYGIAALAGYGVGVRLELLQVPLVFAIGQAQVALIGTNIGAGHIARAKRVAWIGAAMTACMSLSIGLIVFGWPELWVQLFSQDPAVLATGSTYLRLVGPFYPFLALGVCLYFASQGSGRVVLPVLAGTARLIVAVTGGALLVRLNAPLWTIFVVIALGLLVYGSLTVWAVARTDWTPKPKRPSP